MGKKHFGSPNFDSAADTFARVVQQTDSRFTPGEADFWIKRFIEARQADQEIGR